GTGSAPPTLHLDGVGRNTTCEGNCNAQAITTARGHDVRLLIVECGFNRCPVTISSISDSSGLTFTQRASYAPIGSENNILWEYYAKATSPLTSDNITVAFDGRFTIHDIQVLAVLGANTRASCDPDPSLRVAIS